MTKINLAISPKKTILALFCISIGLTIVSLVSQFLVFYWTDFPFRDGISMELDITSEGNIPTLYSSILLLISAALIGVISKAESTH